VAEGNGSYLEQITFDDKPLWEINGPSLRSAFKVPEDKKLLLPSDSRMRADLQCLEK
jgi:hypothetical protein